MNRLRYLSLRLLWSARGRYRRVRDVPRRDVDSRFQRAADDGLGGGAEAIQEARENQPPRHVLYVGWMVSVFTFQWGHSSVYGQPVAEVIAERLPVTLAYVVPATLFGSLGATLLGYRL